MSFHRHIALGLELIAGFPFRNSVGVGDAVTDGEGSARLLRELARSNLFVVSLDEQDEWYRYHHLFSELLLYELRSTRPDLVPTLR